ncbi:serine O-acetyltransferase [Methylophaga sp.]|jgi:serine O-acetyltransferase|uniref:serine O-acetyltransferase n=1 Tax=Methylophaga sp. TaxID=2024840 RepID=UPI0027213051|nr:serine acetyltransferase [Methylophaga sp.]MDO8825458.1 serine acetyltransferase [Methylophaga sp.]
MISSEVADWERERIKSFWSPARQLLKSIRDYQKSSSKKSLLAKFNKKIAVIRYRFWSAIAGADIPINGDIGGGLSIPHPNGIVIHPEAKIGVNCLIHQQVTIGISRKSTKAPTIYGHVDIGAGAKIIGPIIVGEHALIGANAVVVKDVPAYAIVAGIPAKIIGTTAEGDHIV